MLLEPFLYDFVADHQRALREAAEHGRGGTQRRAWWRLRLGTSAAVALGLVRPLASPRRGCGRRLQCRHAAAGNDV